MKIKPLVNYFLKKYPLALQENWDESGLLAFFDNNQDVKSCIVCLDLTNHVIDQALRQNAQIIISHHPIFTKNPDHSLNKKELVILQRLQDNRITCLSLHTCFDNNKYGMNFLLAQQLDFNSFNWFNKDANSHFIIGDLKKPLTITQVVTFLKEKFTYGQMFVSNVNDNNKSFSNIAICAGAGFDVFAKDFDKLVEQTNLLFITGDIKYHHWITIKEYGLNFLDVGHEIENLFVDAISQHIHEKFKTIKVTKIYSEIKKNVL